MSLNRAIASRVREERTARGWSRERLRDKANSPCSLNQLAMLERGEAEWAPKFLEPVAKALGVPVRSLMPNEGHDTTVAA